MSVSSYDRSGGSFVPANSKEILEYQLFPETKCKEFGTESLHSVILNADLTVWDQAAKDLRRLGNLELNGKKIIAVKQGISPSSDEIFDDILGACGNDREKAIGVANLMTQSLWGEVHVGILRKRRMQISDSESVVNAKMMGLAYSIDIQPSGKFTIIHEAMFQITPFDGDPQDPSQQTYVKEKLVVYGKLEDLKKKNFKALDLKVLYTKEHPTTAAAEKDTYWSVWSEERKTLFRRALDS